MPETVGAAEVVALPLGVWVGNEVFGVLEVTGGVDASDVEAVSVLSGVVVPAVVVAVTVALEVGVVEVGALAASQSQIFLNSGRYLGSPQKRGYLSSTMLKNLSLF